jgi:hypothetical protein
MYASPDARIGNRLIFWFVLDDQKIVHQAEPEYLVHPKSRLLQLEKTGVYDEHMPLNQVQFSGLGQHPILPSIAFLRVR